MTRLTGMMTVALASFLLSATLYAVPFTVQNESVAANGSTVSKEVPPQLISSTEEAEVNNYVSGDTAHYICDRKIFQYSSTNGEGGTDCWGYRAPNGDEYAIFGVINGIAIVNTQTLTAFPTIPGPQNNCGAYWRDMKSYKQYVYAVSECTGTNAGLIVISMANVPASVNYVGSFPVNGAIAVTSHNLSIDTAKGYAYLEGTTTLNQSIYIHNLANPAAPVFVSSFGGLGLGIHDIYAYNDTVLVAEGSSPSIAVYNVSDKMTPVLITRWSVPNPGYVHNVWPREDHQYCATTEETAHKTIKIWDIHDLQNVQLVGEVLAPSQLAHNAHWMGNKLYMSHYESGMVIIDVTDPTNPSVDLSYDTYATETPNFNGCWGAFPFTSSGDIYASNLDGKMYILEERNDTLADTLWADTTVAQSGNDVEVTIYASNSHPVHKFQIPLSWVGPSNLSFSTTSRVGTRTDYFQSETNPATDLGNSRIVINLTASTNNTAPDLPAGSGPILKVTFSVPNGVNGTTNPISFTPYVGVNTYTPSFSSKCINVMADTIYGAIKVTSCCVGIRGDANGNGALNVLDLNYLVAYFFSGGPTPPCAEEADVNGNGSLNVLDLNALVAYFFSGGVSPAACP